MKAAESEYRMAVYTFGATSATAGLTNVAPLSSDLSSVRSRIANMDVMTVKGQNQFNDQDTNYDGIMSAINAAIPAAGSGTQAAPQKVLFFVSDGVADENNPNSCSQQTVSGGRCQEPISLALCTALKNRGVLIAVLYTTYLPLPTNSWYNQYIKPVRERDQPDHAKLRVAGTVFRGEPHPGDFRGDDRAVPERGDDGAPHQVRSTTCGAMTTGNHNSCCGC